MINQLGHMTYLNFFFYFFVFFFVMNYILQSDTSFVYNATKIWSHEIYEFYS